MNNFKSFDRFNEDTLISDAQFKEMYQQANKVFNELKRINLIDSKETFENNACFISSNALHGFYLPNLFIKNFIAISFINNKAVAVFDDDSGNIYALLKVMKRKDQLFYYYIQSLIIDKKSINYINCKVIKNNDINNFDFINISCDPFNRFWCNSQYTHFNNSTLNECKKILLSLNETFRQAL